METDKPIYDEKVNYTLEELMKGKNREEIAKELGYDNYKSLDIYIRRKNFRWDKAKKIYVPNIEQALDEEVYTSSKVLEIVTMLKNKNNDAKLVANLLGYKDHIEMAKFMKSKGYVYCNDTNKYIKDIGIIKDIEDNNRYSKVDNKEIKEETSKFDNIKNIVQRNKIETEEENFNTEDISKYTPLLDMLLRNKDKLVEILMPNVDTNKIPRYVIGGTFITKSVHMSNKLDRMIKDFSLEKKISQRDMVEVALIEFFRKYGYEAEVEVLTNQN